MFTATFQILLFSYVAPFFVKVNAEKGCEPQRPGDNLDEVLDPSSQI